MILNALDHQLKGDLVMDEHKRVCNIIELKCQRLNRCKEKHCETSRRTTFYHQSF